MELDDLIGSNSFGLVCGLGKYASKTEVAFGPDDKKSRSLMDFVESREIQIPAIEKINGPGFEEEFVEQLDFVNLAVRNENQGGNAAP